MAETESTEQAEVTYGEYKGNPTITLPLGPRGFTFGLSKARAVLRYLDAIRAFVEKHE